MLVAFLRGYNPYRYILFVRKPKKGIHKRTSTNGRPFFSMSQGKQSEFYKSKTWQACRDNYLKSVGGLCEKCKAKGLIVPAEIVHHKIHLNANNITDPSITLNPCNLQAVCRQCHGEEHPQGMIKRYTVGADGSIRARD